MGRKREIKGECADERQNDRKREGGSLRGLKAERMRWRVEKGTRGMAGEGVRKDGKTGGKSGSSYVV